MLRLFLITIFSMMMFAGCNSKQAELSPISKVSADFTTGTASSFPGGLIVVGVRQDVNEKVSFAFSDGNPTPIMMERGDWIFYSFGYSGAETPADIRSGKFAGLAECGYTSVQIRGGERRAINLNLKSDGCSGKLARDTKPQYTYVDTCPAFSYFNNTVPYQFYPQAGANAFACSNMPEDQNSNIKFYKIFALNSNNGVVAESFSSPCLDEVALGTYPRKIPTDIVPLKLKIYRSQASCEGDNIAHNTFFYPNGILSGNSPNFDSLLGVDFTPGYNRLYVPEAHTQRYNSPFMNNIPRIICDTPNCFSSPSTDRTAEVKWDMPSKDQLILADINGNYTCDDFSHYSNFFGFKDCKIKNNSLYATVIRNNLTCQDVPPFVPTYLDLNERNGLIYILYIMNGSTYVTVMTSAGELLKVVTIGANLDYTSITATDSGDFFIGNQVTDTIVHYKRSGNTAWTLFTDYTVTDPGIIEVTPDGRYLAYAGLTSYRINILDVTSAMLGYMMPSDTPQYVRKLQFSGGKLYAHLGDDPINDTSSLYRYSFENGVPTYEADLSGVGTNVSWHINNGVLNYLTPSYTVGTVKNYETASNYLGLTSINGPTGPFVRMVDDIVVVNNTVYGIQKNFSDLLSLQWVGGLFVQPTVTANECTDTFNILLRGQVVGTHKIVSNLVPDDTEKSLRIFEAGDKLIGKAGADNKYYFKSLNEEQSRNTSGGALSLAQRLLGPHGVGGMLSEYADCNAVKTMAQVMPIRKTIGVTDPYRGYQSFSVRVQPNTEVIPKLICNDGIANDSTCTNQYELKITVTSTGLLENESYRIKMHCTSQIGQIDYRNTNRDESWKQQLYWNTTLSTLSRVDNYKIFRSDDHDYFETSLIHTNGSFVRGRLARKDFWTDYNTATILDYQRETASANHYVRKVLLGASGSTTPAGYAAVRSETTFNGVGEYCLDSTESNPATSSVGICMFDDVLTDRVKQPGPGINPTVSLTALENEFTFESLFDDFP